MASADLGSVAARGASTTVLIQGVRFAVQFGGIVLLGRLLSPDDFGLIVMVTAIVGLGDVLRDFGLMAAAVQAKSLSVGQRNVLFWLNSSIGLAIAVACFVFSPLISAFYDDDRLGSIASVLALTFFVNGIQTQFQAHLTRSMRFRALSLTDLFSQILGLGAAVIAAVLGLDYWALVIQLIVQPVSLLGVRILICDWSPGFSLKGGKIGSEIRYGSNLMFTQVMVYLSSNVDSILVGARFGASSAGLYNRAFQLLMMPLNQIFAPATAVALPILSRLSDDQSRYQKFLERGQRLIIYPALVLFAGIAAIAEPLFILVFGEVWAGSAVIFQWLALGGAFQSASYIAYWIFLSKGLTGSHFRYSLITRSALILLVLIGSTVSLQAVSIAYSVGLGLAWPFCLIWLRRAAHIRVGSLFFISIRGLISGLLGFVSGFVTSTAFVDRGELVQCICGMTVSLVVFVITTLSTKGGRDDAQHILKTIKLLERKV